MGMGYGGGSAGSSGGSSLASGAGGGGGVGGGVGGYRPPYGEFIFCHFLGKLFKIKLALSHGSLIMRVVVFFYCTHT